MSTLLPYPRFKAVDSTGTPYAGGKVYTYIAGTSTAKASYSDAACATPNTNPVVLDSNGEATIYLKGIYKIVLKTSADVTVWTLDGVQGMGQWEEGMSYPDYNEVDQGAVGSGASIKDLVDAIGSENATIYLVHNSGATTTTYTLSTSLTVPSNISLKFQKGAKISIAASKTLTINGVIEAADFEVFTGTGTLSGSPIVGLFLVDWVNAGVTNSTTPTGTLKSIGASNVQGDIYYHDGTNVTRLAAGTKGQALITQGSGANVAWGAQHLIKGAYKNLVAYDNGDGASVTIKADELVVADTSANTHKLTSVNVTITRTTSGANGLDTGTQSGGVWYYLYVIYNPSTSTKAGLMSLSATAPVLPSGYTHSSGVLSMFYMDAGVTIQQIFRQIGNSYIYRWPKKLVDSGGSQVSAGIWGIPGSDIPYHTSYGDALVQGAWGKAMMNTGSGHLFMVEYITGTTSQDVDNNVCPVTIRFDVASTAQQWTFPSMINGASIYYQTTGNTVDIWLCGFWLNI